MATTELGKINTTKSRAEKTDNSALRGLRKPRAVLTRQPINPAQPGVIQDGTKTRRCKGHAQKISPVRGIFIVFFRLFSQRVLR
jgi:hypothetical protein